MKFDIGYYDGEKTNSNEKIAQQLSTLNAKELFSDKLPKEITNDSYPQLIEAFSEMC